MIPKYLRTLAQWVVAGNNKIPLNPRTLEAASVIDESTWSTYEEACAAATKHGLHLGLNLKDLIGIDFDKPRNEEELRNHNRIYDAVQSYTERSISGEGVHIICHGSIPHAVKRNHVEIYGKERYFIMTGDHIPGRPTEVLDCNAIVNEIVAQAGEEQSIRLEHGEPEKESDLAVYDKCRSYANGKHFLELWSGHWEQRYPSQSEADYALINMLAFVSMNNEQVRRMFRTSGLGQRPKAQRDDHIDRPLSKIRAEQQPPPIDFSKFEIPPLPAPIEHVKTAYEFPGGLVGEVAQYIMDTAIKPIPQVALAGGLGLLCGLAGRTYNISNTGLNLYLLCVAGQAIGKEGAGQGMNRVMKEVVKKLPAAQPFIGPGRFASGQGLVKRLEETPCFVSKMSEFGHVIRRVCSPSANGADVMWRELFLELFNLSGPTDVLAEMVYSDAGKNTARIMSPAFSIVGDTTASTLFENMSEEAVEMGLVPRFILLECGDTRPRTNPNAWAPPPQALVDRVEQLAMRCMSMSANATRQAITIEPAADKLLKALDEEIDDRINKHKDDVIGQIWSRTYMKALRLAGVVAVGKDGDNPAVTEEDARWAIQFCREDALNMQRRFGDGVGGGDSEQIARLRQIIINTLHAKSTPRKMKELGVVSNGLISPRAYSVACFKTDRMGAGFALKRTLQALMDNGELVELTSAESIEHFKNTARHFHMTPHFQTK